MGEKEERKKKDERKEGKKGEVTVRRMSVREVQGLDFKLSVQNLSFHSVTRKNLLFFCLKLI